MSDEITVTGLRLDAVIGVYAHERRIHQRLVVDLRVATDIREASSGDDIKQAIDYDRLCEIAEAIARAGPHWLIETVAEQIAAKILAEFTGRVSAVTVEVHKPGARTDVSDVSVKITRGAPKSAPL